MAFPDLGDSGYYIVSDTILCDGTGGLLGLLKGFKKKATFLADPGLYSHYNVLLKRFGVNVNYWEFSVNQEVGDLPLTENPPSTWVDAPRRIEVTKLLETLSKGGLEVVVFSDIMTVVLEIGALKTVELIFELGKICQAVVVKGIEEVIKQLWIIEQVATAGLYFSPLTSGVSSEYLGKVRIELTQGLVKSEIGVFYYKIVADNLVLAE